MFTKLDISQAYLQFAVDNQAKELLTINTHKGLFAYTVIGVSSAPEVFQHTMESLLSSISNVLVYLHDILVTGHDQEQQVSNLHKVLVRFREASLRLKKQQY